MCKCHWYSSGTCTLNSDLHQHILIHLIRKLYVPTKIILLFNLASFKLVNSPRWNGEHHFMAIDDHSWLIMISHQMSSTDPYGIADHDHDCHPDHDLFMTTDHDQSWYHDG